MIPFLLVMTPYYVKCDSHTINKSQLPRRMNEQLLKVSAPQNKSSFQNLKKTYGWEWHRTMYVRQLISTLLSQYQECRPPGENVLSGTVPSCPKGGCRQPLYQINHYPVDSVFFFCFFLSTLTHTSQRFVWDSVIYFSTTGAREDTLNLAHFHQNKIQLVCETISGYFEVLARNCLLSALYYIVMQMRSTLDYIVINCRGSFYS